MSLKDLSAENEKMIAAAERVRRLHDAFGAGLRARFGSQNPHPLGSEEFAEWQRARSIQEAA